MVRDEKLATFTTPTEFFAHIHEINFEAEIYIDCELGNGLKGDEVGEIYAKGFKKIYLCTGHPASSFPPMPWIVAVVGKMPPFVEG